MKKSKRLRPNDEQIHVSPAAKKELEQRALKEGARVGKRVSLKAMVDKLVFPGRA